MGFFIPHHRGPAVPEAGGIGRDNYFRFEKELSQR